MGPSRVLLVCDPGLLAQGLRLLLEADDRIQVVGMSEPGQALAKMLKQVAPDVLLVQQDAVSLMIGDPPEKLDLDQAPVVILVGKNRNVLRICRLEERALTDTAGLVDALSAV